MGQGVPSSGASGGRAPPVSPGDILAGKYRVERVLGAGGMGVVVAATHIDLLERRAIKFMLASQLGDAEAVERFLREARASSRLKGEHVAKVHDVGRLDNGAPYMVMEYLTGGDLRVLLKKRGSIPTHEAALYILQACEALAEAHGAGIVHRDIKPENLFLTRRPDGTPSIKVLDFGISKMMGKQNDLAVTSTQAIMGSPYYMSPEQLRASRDVDPRTDIWSLGVILYQLVTNNLPFEGKNLTSLIAAVIFGPYPPASQVKLGLGEGLDGIIARCLEKETDRRYPTIAELAEDLLTVAPPAASQSVERILRLLRPNSPSPSDRLALSSYDAPVSSGEGSELPTPPAPPAPLAGATTHPAARSPATDSHPSSPDTTVPEGSSTDPAGGTLRSGNLTPVAEARGETSGSWGGSVPSVRVVVQPSRAPVLILAAGCALALVIASVALLLGRAARRDDIGITPTPATGTATAVAAPVTGSVTVGPAGPATVAEPPRPPDPAATTTVTPGVTATLGAPFPTGGLHPTGKHGVPPSGPSSKPSADPSKPPHPSGDPFGEGRQ